ncbi:MAG TPA: hypothetical protein VGS58_13895 [Candidatus Sulfopaludibacter sp.]|nr:hypothetical protein [Candidatus Sulfopaludibacter sp.]
MKTRHHAGHEVRRIVVQRFGCGVAFLQRGNLKGIVPAIGARPCALVRDFAELLLPKPAGLLCPHQRKRPAGDNRDVGAPHPLEQPQRVRDFLIAPRIAHPTVMPSGSTDGDCRSTRMDIMPVAPGPAAS